MITEQELRDVFQTAFVSDTDAVVYRKNTSDTIPQYTLRLANLSDTIHIKAYLASPTYINATEAKNGFPLTETEGIILPPLTTADVTITIDTTGIDTSTDETPRIAFELRALEPLTSTPSETTPSTDPREDGTPEATPGTGIDTGSTDKLFPTRRKTETEVDDFVGPIAQQ